MQTLIIRAPGRITNPGKNNPRIDLLDTRLLAAFDANDIASADGAAVSAWESSGGAWGAGANLSLRSGSTSAVLDADGVSQGNASVKFTSAGFVSPSTNARAEGNITVMALLKTGGALGTQNFFSGAVSSAYAYANIDVGQSTHVLTVGGSSAAAGSTIQRSNAFPLGSWVVLEIVYAGTTAEILLNGAPAGSGTIVPAALTGISVGSNTGGSNLFTGDIAAFRVYSASLPESARASVRSQWLSRVR